MAFADDLLRDASHLIERGGKNPKQSTLRRGVSTAYYALFHLLVADFVAKWPIKDQRARLGRMFDHGRMSNAGVVPTEKNKLTPVEEKIKGLVKEFAEIQGARHTADYDIGYRWTRTDARSYITRTEKALELWSDIRSEKAAQNHLLTMFGAKIWPPLQPSASSL